MFITCEGLAGVLGNKGTLMTCPKENSKFCFPETLNVPRGEAEFQTTRRHKTVFVPHTGSFQSFRRAPPSFLYGIPTPTPWGYTLFHWSVNTFAPFLFVADLS